MAITITIPARARASVRAGIAAPAVLAAGLLSVEAAAIHAVVAPAHFAEWWGYGLFFALVAVAQVAFVPLLARAPRPWVLQAGIWLNVVCVVMYLVTRTRGIPLGPEAGTVEEVEALGVGATAAEAVLVVVLCGLLGGDARRRTFNCVATLGVAIWIAAFAGLLTPAQGAAVQSHNVHHGNYNYGEGPVPSVSDAIRNGTRPWGDG
jgi:hypothetical protein